MKNIPSYILAFLLLSLSLNASPPELEPAPEITYAFLKKHIDMSAQYSNIDIEGQTWHLHWHMDQMPDLEEMLSTGGLTIKVQKNKDFKHDSVGTFACYDIAVICNETGQQHCPYFPFYLSIPDTCRISHGASKMYPTQTDPVLGSDTTMNTEN